jgi:hypothetical protein
MSIRPLIATLVLATFAAQPGMAQTPPTAGDAKAAVSKGVAWLLRQQQGDGHFPQVPARNDLKAGEIYFDGVMTALAVMALHNAGHRPSASTPEGEAMTRGVGYLCNAIEAHPDKGSMPWCLGRFDRSRMYGHGIMGWMLATVAPELKDREMRQSAGKHLQRSIVVLLDSQKVLKSERYRGGWRYETWSSDSDISVTVWQLLALDAAAKAGFEIPEETWTLASGFLKRTCRTNAPASSAAPRGFGYEPWEGGRLTASTTAAGVVGMLCCKQADAPETAEGVRYLLASPPSAKDPWLFYGLKHASHAARRLGGESAVTFAERARSVLLPLQSEDGSWAPQQGNEKSAGTLYATAMAVMALSAAGDSH